MIKLLTRYSVGKLALISAFVFVMMTLVLSTPHSSSALVKPAAVPGQKLSTKQPGKYPSVSQELIVEVEINVTSDVDLQTLLEMGLQCTDLGPCKLEIPANRVPAIEKTGIEIEVKAQAVMFSLTADPSHLEVADETYLYAANETDSSLGYMESDQWITVTGAPTGAQITQIRYSARVAHNRLDEIELYLGYEGSADCLESYPIWTETVSWTDSGTDDDPENDYDVDLRDRWITSGCAMGETVNGQYQLTVYDYYDNSYSGYIDYFRVWIYYEEPTVQVVDASTADENWSAKSNFISGDSIRYIIWTENTTGGIADIELIWDVRGSGGEQVYYWKGVVTQEPGTWGWGLLHTLPVESGGTHTFTGQGNYQGHNSEAKTNYYVVVPDVGPLVYYDHEIDDDNIGNSRGNNNGEVDCGETIEMAIRITNEGSNAADLVDAQLDTTDSYTTIIENLSYAQVTVSPGEIQRFDNYEFSVNTNTPDGHVIPFQLLISDETYGSSAGPWEDAFVVPVACLSTNPPPTLSNISNGDQDGNYNVNWSTVSGASSYELQEQHNGGSWNAIYSGSSTNKDVSGKAVGDWCYRVRASNAGSSSDWSAVKCTTVNEEPLACYNLELTANPSGGGTIAVDPLPNCVDKYFEGTSVKLTAQQTSGHKFDRWNGDLSGRDNPSYITMNSDKSVRAEFIIDGDPQFSLQWALEKIKILQAWARTRGSEDVVIAVIDTGVDYGHVDLSGAKTLTANDFDYANNDDDARDDQGHGTHVAGIAAANTDNGFGIAGVCPLCRILPIKALDAGGRGSFTDIAQAIRYAADEGVDVINLSLGSLTCTDELADAVNYAYERDVILVAAAGNACPTKVALGLETFEVNFPARFERVIAVAATDQNDNRADFSCYGPAVDISAPGVEIWSTHLNGSYKSLDGTSMAAPHVAGVAGLLVANDTANSPSSVQDILQRSAKDTASGGWDDKTGWGRLDSVTSLTTPPISVQRAPPARCPSVPNSVSPRTKEENLLDLYRRVRDEVLSPSYVGQSYTALYNEYGPTLATILLTEPVLLSRTAQFLKNAEEEFASLLPDATGKMTLSRGLYDEANALVQDLAGAGDEEFSAELLETWGDLELEIYIDEDTVEIWEEIQKVNVFVPLIGG